ncbi:hypothetical protein [Peribacillus sp. FSL E2-0218]|uniref:hypothetical protein n=1 Tax=Peribacillus sp. FSL E2-0218 TaxID=2921364 RepID=UPI0030EE469F
MVVVAGRLDAFFWLLKWTPMKTRRPAKALEGGARLTCYKKAKNGGKDGDQIEKDFSQALM